MSSSFEIFHIKIVFIAKKSEYFELQIKFFDAHLLSIANAPSNIQKAHAVCGLSLL